MQAKWFSLLVGAVVVAGAMFVAAPQEAKAQVYSTPVVTYYRPRPVLRPFTVAPAVGYVNTVGYPAAVSAYYAPTTAYYAPTTAYYAAPAHYVAPNVLVAPTTTYYAPSVITPPVTSYYAPTLAAPVTTYYRAPTVIYRSW